MNGNRKRSQHRRIIGRWSAWVPFVLALAAMSPVAAESNHWGTGVAQFRMTTDGIPLSTEKPRGTSWSFGPSPALIAVWHRGAEFTSGEATFFGSLDGRKENTLGGVGSASLTFPAPVAGRPFTASASGAFIRTQTLIQIDLDGTATDGNGEVVPIRITGSGTWRPTAGDGTLVPITEAEVALTFVFIFPGDMPPPPGPKAGSALDFAGTATLPTFPCPPPLPGQLPCQGTFAGEVEGIFGGDAGPGTWALQMVAPITATFSYADLIEPGAGCLEGLATGLGASEGGQTEVLGIWTDRIGIPRFVTGAKISFGFDWRREGLTAALVLRDLDVRLHAQGMGWVQVVAPGSSTGPAVAAFAPDLTEEHIEACEQGVPGPAITATVNGAGTIDGF